MSIRQPAARLRCLHRHGRSKLCGTFHPGGKGKEVYLNKELIKNKININLYYRKRKVEFYLNKSTRDKKNINLYYQKEKGNKEEEVSERKEGSDDEKESKCIDKGKKERKERGKKSGLDQKEVKKERKGREKKSGLDKNKSEEGNERKRKERRSGQVQDKV